MGNALRFRHTSVPKQAGELARLKVVHGPDAGAIYVLTGARATLGRGEDNDVVISDLKASRLHAELLLGPGGWSFRDLASSNGVMLNGKAAQSAALKLGDAITVGETTLEFTPVEAGTQLLTAPARSIDRIHAEQSAMAARKAGVRALGKLGGSGSGPSPAAMNPTVPKNDKKRTLLLVTGAALVALMLIFPEEKGPPARGGSSRKPSAKGGGEARDLAAFLPKVQEGPTSRTADTFFRTGFREYREGNYLRARIQFETVLQIDPGHSLAKRYLEDCEHAISEEVKSHLDIGKKSLEAGKLRQAKGHFEAVIRLLHRDRASSDFIEAKDQLDKVLQEIQGGRDG